MATTGTYAFNPTLGEITLYAFNLCGIRNTAILQEHLTSARMASNFLLSRWANMGVNLWAVDLQTVPLVAGQATYSVPANTILVLDAYVSQDDGSSGPSDRVILPISRSEYATYPNKEQQGAVTAFWFDRLLAPEITLWPVPDGQSANYLKYYRVRQIQDAALAGAAQMEIPYAWMEAFADGLAHRLSRIWAPLREDKLKISAEESYSIAAGNNVERANQYISPVLSGYWRQ